MADKPETKTYRVLSTLAFNGKEYGPDKKLNTVSLSDDEAAPLLNTGAIDPNPVEEKPKK